MHPNHFVTVRLWYYVRVGSVSRLMQPLLASDAQPLDRVFVVDERQNDISLERRLGGLGSTTTKSPSKMAASIMLLLMTRTAKAWSPTDQGTGKVPSL